MDINESIVISAWEKRFWDEAGNIIIGELPPDYNLYLNEIYDEGIEYINNFISQELQAKDKYYEDVIREMMMLPIEVVDQYDDEN